jgi:hypothetical protein
MNEFLHILAQQSLLDQGRSNMRMGAAGIGVGVLILAIGVVMSNPGKNAKVLPWVVRYMVAMALAAIGFGALLYAWCGIP